MLFRRQKKGFELSMNVIIVAALALIVLVVVILMFTGRVRTVNQDLDSCQAKGGTCSHLGAVCQEGSAKITASSCGQGIACCISFT